MSVYKKGDNWFLDYRAGGRRIREKVGPSRRLAESALAKRRLEIAEKRFLNVRKTTRLALREFAPRYLEWAAGRMRSIQQETSYLRRLNRSLGDLTLPQLDVARLEEYMSQRLKERRAHPFRGRAGWGLSEEDRRARIARWELGDRRRVGKAQINREVSCLNRVLNRAVAWKLLDANPLRGIRLFDEREFIRKRYLKPEEIRALLAACPSNVREIVTFALYTGRRFGEIVGMRWRDVDLDNGFALYPKTKKGEPDQVALPPGARRLLEAMKPSARSEHVFGKRDGGPIRDVRWAFHRALRAAGIADFHFHDLRHTAVSYMLMSGVDLKTAAALVGHTNAQMIDRRYGHLSPDHKRLAAEIFGASMDRLCGAEAPAGRVGRPSPRA